jgi:eukaryotic translation initiation factor 2C
MEMKQKSGNVPDIYVVVLPEGATDLYQQVKQYVPLHVFMLFIDECPSSFSDCQVGVATQCLKAQKCFRAKPQYYANVMLKYVLPHILSRLSP